jgi:hypothetical protein
MSGRGELHHPHVPRIEVRDEALDCAALAGGVPALEQHAQRRADPLIADQPSECEAELREPTPGAVQRPLLLLAAQ